MDNQEEKFEIYDEAKFIGKIIIIGITYFDKNNEVKNKHQWWGKIIAFNLIDGLKIDLSNSGKYPSFPPFFDIMKKAKPGIYKLKSTGEEIENPDYLYTIATYDKKD